MTSEEDGAHVTSEDGGGAHMLPVKRGAGHV